MTFTGQSHLFQRFNNFFITNGGKEEKAQKKEKYMKHKRGVYAHLSANLKLCRNKTDFMISPDD